MILDKSKRKTYYQYAKSEPSISLFFSLHIGDENSCFTKGSTSNLQQFSRKLSPSLRGSRRAERKAVVICASAFSRPHLILLSEGK